MGTGKLNLYILFIFTHIDAHMYRLGSAAVVKNPNVVLLYSPAEAFGPVRETFPMIASEVGGSQTNL